MLMTHPALRGVDRPDHHDNVAFKNEDIDQLQYRAV